MTTIGIIDDNDSERDDIKVAIDSIWASSSKVNDKVEFKDYPLDPNPGLKERLEKSLLNDINSENIQSLIVDYKLDSVRRVIKGKDIVEYLHDRIPAFPTVILTNAPDAGMKEDTIDPDKVYSKEIFLDLESEVYREMVFKIYRNIQRYRNRRLELKTSLDKALQLLSDQGDSDVELLSKISDIEEELSDYMVTGKSTTEKALDLGELHDLVNDLMKIEDKLK